MSWANTHRTSWRQRWGNGKWMPPAFVALALVSGGLYWWNVEHQQDTVSCQAEYNAYFSTSASARAAAADADRRAQSARDDNQDALFTGVASLITRQDPAATPSPEEQSALAAEYRQLFDTYLVQKERAQAVRAEADRIREENPVPPAPTCVTDDYPLGGVQK